MKRPRMILDEGGQSLAELALALPMLVFLLIGGADLARAYAIQLAVQNGARAGAESAVLDRTPTVAATVDYAKQEMGRTPGLDAAAAAVTMTTLTAAGGACPVPPSVAAPCYVTVRVVYTFKTLVPWPLIQSSFTFDRITVMRRFN